ncbi:MAG TPA: tetratricopeptide repeat protein, partial [Allosphingosinicella sp.]
MDLSLVIWLALLGAAPAAPQADGVVPRLEALAASGSGEAAYHLGMIYHLGLSGVPKNPAKAFEQFKLATERGDALGAYKLGCFYAGQGDGTIAPDPRLALRWKLVAAEAGYARAQEEVAETLRQGGDLAGALPWYEAAARQGSPRALMLLGILYDPKPSGAAIAPDRVKSYAYMA